MSILNSRSSQRQRSGKRSGRGLGSDPSLKAAQEEVLNLLANPNSSNLEKAKHLLIALGWTAVAAVEYINEFKGKT